jgi:hypothetical protein
MSDEKVRGEVVDALVAAHSAEEPWAHFAAVAFEFTPPPTDAERDEARSIYRGRGADHLSDPQEG